MEQSQVNNEYVVASSHESWVGNGKTFGIKILVSMDRKLTDNDKNVISEKMDECIRAINLENDRLDPEVNKNKELQKKNILSLFEASSVYVKEIPNEYYSAWSYRSPWFLITTCYGVIKVGWRKRVLVIDWKDSDIKVFAEDLFKDEKTTKGDYMIHAWSYEDAKKYIDALFRYEFKKAVPNSYNS